MFFKLLLTAACAVAVLPLARAAARSSADPAPEEQRPAAKSSSKSPHSYAPEHSYAPDQSYAPGHSYGADSSPPPRDGGSSGGGAAAAAAAGGAGSSSDVPRPQPNRYDRYDRYDPYDDTYYNSDPLMTEAGRPPRRYPATADYDSYMLGGPERSLYRRPRSRYPMGMPPSLMAAYMMSDMDFLFE